MAGEGFRLKTGLVRGESKSGGGIGEMKKRRLTHTGEEKEGKIVTLHN